MNETHPDGTRVGITHRTTGAHWLVFDHERRIVGCHCGFAAHPDDTGFGDSVIDHIEQVVRSEIADMIRGTP